MRNIFTHAVPFWKYIVLLSTIVVCRHRLCWVSGGSRLSFGTSAVSSQQLHYIWRWCQRRVRAQWQRYSVHRRRLCISLTGVDSNGITRFAIIGSPSSAMWCICSAAAVRTSMAESRWHRFPILQRRPRRPRCHSVYDEVLDWLCAAWRPRWTNTIAWRHQLRSGSDVMWWPICSVIGRVWWGEQYRLKEHT